MSKGAAFERKTCVELSLWITGGKKRDCFWRSAMSGGRATVAFKRGVRLDRQAGDICAISPEGHVLTDRYFFEVKHRKAIRLDRFALIGSGPLAGWWRKAVKEAKRHRREPVMIIRGNMLPTIVITKRNNTRFNPAPTIHVHRHQCCIGLWSSVLEKSFDGLPRKGVRLLLGDGNLLLGDGKTIAGSDYGTPGVVDDQLGGD